MENNNFIMTSNQDTAERLKCLGFDLLIDGKDNKWVFMNNGTITFSAMPDIVYTNKLFF